MWKIESRDSRSLIWEFRAMCPAWIAAAIVTQIVES